MSLLAGIISILESEVKNNTKINVDEDFNPVDYFGGNFDDTFYGAESSGRRLLAEEILQFIRDNT